jgi:EAL domain-containing protein (putative c-di-GMP-specific phosphodiesterase class I)
MKYQPKVDLMTGQIVGFEALARWTHAEHGPIPPSHFVTETEQMGLVIPLTLLTLDLSLGEVARWQECLPDVSVAVNLSARSLQDATLPEMLERALKKRRVRPDWVTLEITESALMVNPERALRVAEEIARLGIRLAIDDFGTGYSSLAYLSRLPVSELKVDKSFVLRMLDYERDARIVQSTIDLAHNLGLKVVAEGVETAHVLARLRDLGCDAAQGYLIGTPSRSPTSSELRPALGQPFVCVSNSLPNSLQIRHASAPTWNDMS